MPRVLILTASVGEGHDLPARMLAAQLEAEQPGVDVVTEDALAPMGRFIASFCEDGAGLVFFRLQWLWDLTFWLFVRFPAPCRSARRAARARSRSLRCFRFWSATDDCPRARRTHRLPGMRCPSRKQLRGASS